MTWEQLEGQWKHAKGSVRQHFSQLTEQDLDQTRGKRDALIGKIQERYSLAREQAQKQAEEMLAKLNVADFASSTR